MCEQPRADQPVRSSIRTPKRWLSAPVKACRSAAAWFRDAAFDSELVDAPLQMIDLHLHLRDPLELDRARVLQILNQDEAVV
jgi:hypothetical protein